MLFRLLLILGCCAPLLVLNFSTSVRAEEEAADEAAKTEEPAADPFAVPEGDNQVLLEFISKVEGMQPQGNSREEMIESFRKKFNAVQAAAEKVLSQEPDDKARTEATQAKMTALMRLIQIGDADAAGNLEKFAAEVAKGDDAKLATMAKMALAQLRMRKIAMGNLDGADELIKEAAEALANDPDDSNAVRSALQLAQALEYSGDAGAKLAAQAYKKFATAMAASSNPQVAEQAKRLEGVVRRLELPGNEMKLSGTLLDGTTFDPTTLKGKVVLVDFWATWCGPCVAELPNVLENYEKYHDKGFEVIGISLDNDREALEKFMEERKLPWPILFEDGDETRGWKNPLAEKYGIMGIPTVILINAEGKVVSLNARGEKLGKLLGELLGG